MEQELLQNGLKFSLPPSNRMLGMDNLVADLELMLKNNALVDQCAQIIRSHPMEVIGHPLRCTIKNLKKKIKEIRLYSLNAVTILEKRHEFLLA